MKFATFSFVINGSTKGYVYLLGDSSKGILFLDIFSYLSLKRWWVCWDLLRLQEDFRVIVSARMHPQCQIYCLLTTRYSYIRPLLIRLLWWWRFWASTSKPRVSHLTCSPVSLLQKAFLLNIGSRICVFLTWGKYWPRTRTRTSICAVYLVFTLGDQRKSLHSLLKTKSVCICQVGWINW